MIDFSWLGSDERHDGAPEVRVITPPHTYTARIAHVCTRCYAHIQPGQRYRRTVMFGEDGVSEIKEHAHAEDCAYDR
jgi:hypothetical protein